MRFTSLEGLPGPFKRPLVQTFTMGVVTQRVFNTVHAIDI